MCYLFAVDLDQGRVVRVVAHVYDAGHRLLIDSRHGGDRVILEWAKYRADGHMHFTRRLDVLEHDQAAVFENLVDPLADRFVLERLVGHTGNPRTKPKILAQRAHCDSHAASTPFLAVSLCDTVVASRDMMIFRSWSGGQA